MDGSVATENIMMRGRRVLVVGLGRSGLAAAGLLHGLGAHVTAADARERGALSEELEKLPPGVRIETGAHSPSLLDDVDMVVVSPGVPLDQPLFEHARQRGVDVMGEMELAFRLTRPYRLPWVAVTGTNGKSTTTTLIDLMLKRGGYRVITGGNIGSAITAEIREPLEKGALGEVDYVVVEVSSFQLESVRDFSPSMATILNITPDHLDRYDGFNAYVEAKAAVFRAQTGEDRLVLNLDDPVVGRLAGSARSRVFCFSRQRAADACLSGGWIVIRANGREERIVRTADLAMKGVHNIENALAASLNARLCGVDAGVIGEVLAEFPGLEHRMEFVDEVGGVRFYNDSKGTNVGSVRKSLEGFSRGVILVLGGRDKGSDFRSLREHVRQRVKGIVLIGEARDKIREQLGGLAPFEAAEDMDDVVERAFSMAGAGDVVLLSPGCASFDMFAGFEHRGAAFRDAVNRLKNACNAGAPASKVIAGRLERAGVRESADGE